jgi:hypothetical protein
VVGVADDGVAVFRGLVACRVILAVCPAILGAARVVSPVVVVAADDGAGVIRAVLAPCRAILALGRAIPLAAVGAAEADGVEMAKVVQAEDKAALAAG